MDESELWKGNPDLHFIDFKLLNEDIGRFKEGSSGHESKELLRTLVYLKALNDFTVKYHEV